MNRDRQIELLRGAKERQRQAVSKWVSDPKVRAEAVKQGKAARTACLPPKRKQA